MDVSKYFKNEGNAAVAIFAFLQADCPANLEEELVYLGRELKIVPVGWSGQGSDHEEVETDIEADGYLAVDTTLCLNGILPRVELAAGNVGALRNVAEELRIIADQFERRVVNQATQNLTRNLTASPTEQWKQQLGQEVSRAIRQGVGLEHLPQEQVVIALTLTLVREVCKRTPRLLRSLFNAALEFVGSGR